MVALSRTVREIVPVKGAVSPRHGVAASPLAFLFTDLRSSAALYERVGDAEACEIVRRHFEFIAAIVLDHDGKVVKTTGDGVLAAFRSWVDAVRSALAVQTRIADFNWTHASGDADRRLAIKLAVHAGGSVRLKLHNGFDYFGSTVNLAARLRSESYGGDVVLSDVVAEHPRVRLLLANLPTREESLPFRGFDRLVRFVRVLPAVPAGVDCEH